MCGRVRELGEQLEQQREEARQRELVQKAELARMDQARGAKQAAALAQADKWKAAAQGAEAQVQELSEEVLFVERWAQCSAGGCGAGGTVA